MVPQFTRGCLQAQTSFSSVHRSVAEAGVELQTMLGRQPRHEFPVRIRFIATNPVMEVRYGDHKPEFMPKLKQNTQQSEGIGTTRDGHRDPVARRKKPPFCDVFAYPLNHI